MFLLFFQITDLVILRLLVQRVNYSAVVMFTSLPLFNYIKKSKDTYFVDKKHAIHTVLKTSIHTQDNN